MRRSVCFVQLVIYIARSVWLNVLVGSFPITGRACSVNRTVLGVIIAMSVSCASTGHYCLRTSA